ncbi:MAG TPA: hypothetical protein DCX26_03715 [Pseudomonas sp.]|jgi:hypothetical protein|nr:hypothetical protein [Pseudomonas sp.]|tara:strand:+ start:19296 stop:19682 length:387 start_codon:yes stop_codon:yes gene_type:complete
MTHDELAERIEALEGPCREMDREIFKAVGTPLPKAAFGMDIELQPDPNSASGFVMPVGELQVRYECPRYTASIDAAMTLVPEGHWFQLEGPDHCAADVGNDEQWWKGRAATPALALCAAAIRAQGEKS